MGSVDVCFIEERLTDLVGDALGGKGSFSLVSGGSADGRHAIITHLRDEAEAMGCLTVVHNCACPGHGAACLIDALSAQWTAIGGKAGSILADRAECARQSDRSYQREMGGLDLLRCMAAENTIVVVIEEIGSADLETVALLIFLARNVGDLNVMMIATHSRLEEDPLLIKMMNGLRCDVTVHEHTIHQNEEDGCGGVVSHPTSELREISDRPDHVSDAALKIKERMECARAALGTGNIIDSTNEARTALSDSRAIGHHGFELDTCILLGVSLTQAGEEKEAYEVLDKAICLAKMTGELVSQRDAHLRKAELLLFSIGEPDSALTEAVIAEEIGSRTSDKLHRIGSLVLEAMIEAGNGRKDRAEKAFCEASVILEGQPVLGFIKERMLMALAGALLLESKHDLAGMNARYGEAGVLATATEAPDYWSATISMLHGRSLLRLRRPREAKGHLEAAAMKFELMGNAVQSGRVKRAIKESEKGPVPD